MPAAYFLLKKKVGKENFLAWVCSLPYCSHKPSLKAFASLFSKSDKRRIFMAKLRILKDTEPTLRKKSRTVDEINKRTLTLLDDMVETMRKANGVGLAAPQVGVLRKIVVIEVVEGEVLELINPEIIERSGSQTGYEGCLSVPGRTGIVTRPDYVKVKALDRNGEEKIYEGTGLLARCFCHELDHLEGTIYTDVADRMLTEEEYDEYMESDD